METLIEPITGARYKIDTKLNKIKSIKTVSNKLEDIEKYKFEFTPEIKATK